MSPSDTMLRRGPYVLLALATALAALSAELIGRGPDLPAALVLAAVAGVLHRVLADRRWPRAVPGDRAGRFYIVTRTLLAFLLTVLNPFFAVFAVTGYFDQHVYAPRRWGPFVLAATAVSMAGAQSGGLPPQSGLQWAVFGALFVLNAGLSTLFLRVAEQEEEVAAERDATIGQLEAANAALHEAMAENARLHERLVAQARETGVRDERERLALEIHDTIAQSLIGVVTQLQAAEDAGDPAAAAVHRERAAALARDALGEARRSVRGLRPAQLDDAALDVALGRLVRDWSETSGVACELVVTGEPVPQPPDVEATVLRVTQESLANVAKHAAAGRVGVTLSYTDDELVLDVRDDGGGFDPAAVRPGDGGGMGLHGMRQRAARLAGELVVESEVGGGTAVSLRVPAVRGA